MRGCIQNRQPAAHLQMSLYGARKEGGQKKGTSPPAALWCRRLNIAGRDITSRLVDLLQRRGYCFNAAADFDTVRSVKERACYVAADYQRELQASLLGLWAFVPHALYEDQV